MPEQNFDDAVFIAGPTAGGKSALALALAHEIGGEIVNADAIQVYADLRILSARPAPEEEARAPHHLFGVLDGATRCSAGRWARLAEAAIAGIGARGRLAVVVGGTGLYFRALETGLSQIPEIPQEIREEARARRAALGREGFAAEVIAQDPAMARLAVADTQRLLRAWEVFRATGERLSDLQTAPGRAAVPAPRARLVLAPDREALYARCDARFDAMLEAGGLDEARALMARRLDPALPVMKALGAAELIAHLSGRMAFDEAVDLGKRNTRRFAKRQMTWFRNQTRDWPRAPDAQAGLAVIRRALARGPE